MKLIAKTFHGLEEVLAQEIRALGGQEVQVLRRAVQYEGDQMLLYKSNYCLRTALRVLVPIHSFQLRRESDLYDGVKEVDWSEYISMHQTLAVDGTTLSEQMNHSHYIALKSKDAIVDQFRERAGRRPDVRVHEPDLQVNIHIAHDNTCTVSLDSSGESLHKRGYRQGSVEAPLSEVLAAGLVQLSGWQGDTPFHDGMCGSGTLAIEAAMIARNIPPQHQRNYYSCKRWRTFDKQLWSDMVAEAESKVTACNVPMSSSDMSDEAVRISERNAFAAGVDREIKFRQGDFLAMPKPYEQGTMILNPPYDERLQEEDIAGFYKNIGDQFKKSYSGWKAWIISSNAAALKSVGLRPTRKIPVFNGPLECRLMRYELYEGTKKIHKLQGEE